MQYALVNNSKNEAQKGLKGICCCCGREVIAKCGDIKMHHWAHKSLRDCDPWWEPETQWHRDWKNKFPEEYREIAFSDEKNNEIHRADIHTREGITIEFQNSPISTIELKSRDQFYNKLIWVINGLKFKGFQITHSIPDPTSDALREYEFSESKYPVFFNKAEIMKSKPGELVRIYGLNAPELQHIETSPCFFMFDWKRPHTAWFLSTSPVFFDFGHQYLYFLKFREQQHSALFRYLQVIKKSDFITKYSK